MFLFNRTLRVEATRGMKYGRNLLILLMLLHSVHNHPHCPHPQSPYRITTSLKKVNPACGTEFSSNDVDAGLVRNVASRCMFDGSTGEFYHLITWDPPIPTINPVTKYRIEVKYGEEQYCFQQKLTSFRFTRSLGKS